MKKRIIIVLISLVLLAIGVVTYMVVKSDDDPKRYEGIKDSVRSEANRYLALMFSTDKKEVYLYDDDIIGATARGADKKIFLDVDGKNYCKIVVHGYVVNNEWNSKVYLKCKNYKDSDYDDMVEWLKCTRIIPNEYYKDSDMENFKCPKEKQEYLDN